MHRPPRVALIHAVAVAIPPVERAFEELWPEADRINLFDDALSRDRESTTGTDPLVMARIDALAGYGEMVGAGGILFTCSAFGEAIETAAAARKVPVLKPNEAMFEQALSIGHRIGMVATFAPSIASMMREFEEIAEAVGPAARLEAVLAKGALDALKGGDSETHNRLVAEAADELGPCDAILLAHFSTSQALEAVRARTSKPVLTSPHSAVSRLKELMVSENIAWDA